ncbi:MAG: tRNA (guanosine(46)-N7)-methyltransferase TrmB [Bdellovibrionales bacterium]|nr:tRNA (guanosine(46)-N7)-methyltransferase TrmB [Bdellovibrionales bacterium]
MRKWINPYIPRLNEKPHLILRVDDPEDLEGVRESIRAKSKSYEHTICEVCSGSGGHLLELASRKPNALIVGIELRFKRIFRTAEKADEKGLTNIVLLRARAELLSDIFNIETLDEVYCNFPDPWTKKRWKKKRLVSIEFLKQLSGVLKPDGFFSHKTDSREYFESVLLELSKFKEFKVVASSNNLFESPWADESIPTEFEKLFRSKGLPIYFLRAQRNPS